MNAALKKAQVKYAQVANAEVKHIQINNAQVKIAQVYSAQVKNSQVKNAQVQLGQAKDFVIHTLQLARYIHPSIVWCFKGEVNMKKTQKVFKSCLAGNKHWAVGNAAALKFRHLLHIKFNVLDH